MTRARKASSNSVLLLVPGTNQIVARFDSGPEGDSDKVTAAATKARAFLKEVLENESHEFHEVLKTKGLETWNDTPEVVQPKMQFSL